ncbi:PROSC [Symbiodinium microadriaticum]|nr:PROSC [Symbiodinium microadriaticum]
MPWRVLGVRKATSLVVAEQGPPEWLLARLGEREAAALPVLRRSGGLLLAISAGAITPEQIAAGNIAGITGDLGPTTTVMIEGFLEDADADSIDVEMVLVDWPAPLYKHLRAGGVNWPANTVWPHNGDEIVKAVNTDQLATLAREWVQQDEVAISEAYATAVEAPAEAAPNPTEGLLNQLLEQMQATAASVANLRADVDVMKQAPPPPNTGPVDALAQAQQLVGPAPRTRAAVQDVALAAPRGSGALDGEGLEEVAEVGAAGDISTDTLLKTALVKLLEGQTKKKKTKAPGLPLAQALSDSDDEEDSADPLRKLSGARGTMLAERLRLSMESCPQDYIAAIEALAAQMVGDHVPGPATMEKYVKEQLPMGSERGLGYMAWGLARALTLIRAGEKDKCHLILLLLVAALEQYRIDGVWTSAWRLTNLTPPPFAEWNSRASSIAEIRTNHAHARIIHSTWAATVVARLKDEEVLMKRRQKPFYEDRPPKGGKGGPVLERFQARLDDLAELVYGASKQASREPNSGGTTDVVPTVASAVAFPQELSDFSPEPFLPEPFLTAFTSPATLLGDRCPGPPPVINASEKGELWHLCWRWDKVSHEAVLKAFGALDEHEHLKLGYPVFKRFVPIGTPAEVTPARDLQACEQVGHPEGDFLAPFRRTDGRGFHARLLSEAAAYPLAFCQEVAKVIEAVWFRLRMSLMTSREHLGPGTGGRFSQVWLFWLLVVASVALVSGPRPPTQPRDRRDLERGRVTAVTANLRAQLLAAFQEWVMEEEPQSPPVAEIAQQKPIQLALLLEEYGRTLYEQGAPRRDYAETINILVQRFPFAKSFMAGPWKLLTTWETLWPGKIHPPMPLVLMKACVTTALTWGWKRMALSLLLGFYALLRCCEVIALKVSDCLMSSESGCKNVVFLRLTLVKSRTRACQQMAPEVDLLTQVQVLVAKCHRVFPGLRTL